MLLDITSGWWEFTKIILDRQSSMDESWKYFNLLKGVSIYWKMFQWNYDGDHDMSYY